MDYFPGTVIDDMVVEGETYVTATSGVRQFKSKRIVCRCIKCNRLKLFQNGALDRHVGTSHSMCNHEETLRIKKEFPAFYRCWSHIKARIDNPNLEHYERYGGRGLTNDYVDFVDFCDDMFASYRKHIEAFGVENTTIERINNELGYTKGNLKWATWKEQAVNRCTTVQWKCYDTLTGEVVIVNNLKDYCAERGINYKALYVAVTRGQELYKRRWNITKLN